MIERYSLPEMTAVWSETRKLQKWLEVEIAATNGWAAIGVVPADDARTIRERARVDPARVAEHFHRTHHDVTAFLAAVAECLGPEARWIHYGLTSSDVMDTAFNLQIVEATSLIEEALERLLAVLERQAVAHRNTPMIGRTHGVHAEPITLGFKLAVWVDETRRNLRRLAAAREDIAVGKLSGAVGTHANVPPSVEEHAIRELGLRAVPVSTQIIQRDRHAYYLVTLATIAASLEKFATEFRSLQRTEILELEEPFAEGQTGSSAMPHKRNPELTERVCGLARVVRGHAVTALENVALWNERDISHSSAERIIFPDACHLVYYMTRLLTGVLDQMTVHREHLERNLNLTRGLIYSQRVLGALVEGGLSRQDAYKIVQRHAMHAWRDDASLLDLLLSDPEVTARLGADELRSLFDLSFHLQYVPVAFERLGLALPPEPDPGGG